MTDRSTLGFNAPAVDAELSPAGCDRRDRMLGELVGEMRRMRRARRMRRNAAIVLAPVLVAGLAVIWPSRWGQPSSTPLSERMATAKDPAPTAPAIAPAAPVLATPAAIITVVRTRDDIIERHRASETGAGAHTLSDAQLLDALAALDRPAGLVRSGARVWLTRDVADAPPPGDSSNSS